MNDYSSAERPEELQDAMECVTRIPQATQARLLLHDLEADPTFADALREALPDEAVRLEAVWEFRFYELA